MSHKVVEYVQGKTKVLHPSDIIDKNKLLGQNKEQRLDPDYKISPSYGVIKVGETKTEVGEAETEVGEAETEVDETKTEVGETITSVSGSPTWEEYQQNNGVLSEKDWYAANALDPEADFQNTVNALNYAYQTSMATYGENAENLYQMGLQNSGVSDIFQANAFSSYLANMNNAANARIAANKQNKALYNAYLAGEKDKYNTYVQGLEQQSQQNFQGAYTYITSQINSGVTNADAIMDQVKTIYNLSDEQIVKLRSATDGLITTKLEAMSEQTYNAALQQVYTWIDSGVTDADTLMNRVKVSFDLSDEQLAKLRTAIDSFGDEAVNAIVAGMLNRFTVDGQFAYTGSEKDKQLIKNALKGSANDATIAKVIEKMDSELAEMEGADLKDYVNMDDKNKELTSEHVESLKEIAGKDESNKEMIQQDIGGRLTNALNDQDGFKEAYSFVGVTEDAWNNMSDEEKVNSILKQATNLKKNGLIDEEAWANAVSDHIVTTVETAREDKKKDERFDEKNDNRYSYVILNTAADLALFYKEQYKNGEISKEEYDAICVEINNQLDEDERKGLYKNMEVYTEDASEFEQFAESAIQWLPEALEDIYKIRKQTNGALMGAALGSIVNAATTGILLGPGTVAGAGVGGAIASVPGELYDWLVDNPQEAQFFDVWNGLDTEGKHALADIYMAAGPENRVEKPWYQGGLKGWVTQNAINKANKKKTSE